MRNITKRKIKRYTKNGLKTIQSCVKKYIAPSNVITVVSVCVFTWLLISWADVTIHNSEPNPQYLAWNFFDKPFEKLMEWTNWLRIDK